MTRILVTSLFITLFLYTIPSSYATSTEWIKTDEVEYRLIAGNAKEDDIGDTVIYLGMEYKLSPKWHTYWRTAGDAGVPLTLDIEGSQNIDSVEIKWPFPERKVAFGTLQTYTYSGEVILPIVLKVNDANTPVSLKLKAKHMVCDEICIPLNDDFTLIIPPKHKNELNQSLIKNYLKRIPRKNGSKGLTIASADISNDILTVKASHKNGFSDTPRLFIEQSSNNFKFPQEKSITFSDDKKDVSFSIKVEHLIEDEKLLNKDIKLTLVDGSVSIEDIKNVSTAVSAPDAKKKLSNTLK